MICIAIPVYRWFIKSEVSFSVSELLSMCMIVLAMAAILITVDSTNKTIKKMETIENDKVLVAINSLVTEMKYNSDLTEDYIEHAVNGNNVNPTKEGKISYELNKPSFGAYERYLIIACKGDLALAREITELYNKLEACKTSIECVLNFVASNVILVEDKNQADKALQIYNEKISYYNDNLRNISIDIQGKIKIKELIKKLEALR